METKASNSDQRGDIRLLDKNDVSTLGDSQQVAEQRVLDESLRSAAQPDDALRASEDDGSKETVEEGNGDRQGAGASQPESADHGLSRVTIIWRALKLPLYTVALIPLMVWHEH